MSTIEQIYQKKQHREHILDLPDTYIGSTLVTSEYRWIVKPRDPGAEAANAAAVQMEYKSITFSPGLLKIVDEILVNAIDQSIRDPTLTEIRVDISREHRTISVYNNGTGIPIIMHNEYKVYVPELIFCQLLSSSNYADDNKFIGGRNGLGAKLCTIFSRRFFIDISDGTCSYTQTCLNNMSVIEAPVITQLKKKKTPARKSAGHVRITFEPDWERFGFKELSHDMYLAIEKRVYDCCAVTHRRVSIFLNGIKLPIKTFSDYMSMYVQDGIHDVLSNTSLMANQIESLPWEIVVAPSPVDGFVHMSFVNGVETSHGGSHVQVIRDQVVQRIQSALERKGCNNIKPSHIAERLFIGVRASVLNPVFTSQCKEILATKTAQLGVVPKCSDAFLNKCVKLPVLKDVEFLYHRREELSIAKKTDGRKKRNVLVDKLTDALDAGTSKSADCILFLVEGDSAKPYALRGREYLGERRVGVFPLRGKFLNVQDATADQIKHNKELVAIKTILGLKQNMVYDRVNELRYGRVVILTDADVDGIHIRGLLLNLFHAWWPTLLTLPNFLQTMQTPILKVEHRSQIFRFYSQNDYKLAVAAGKIPPSAKVRYLKGLGTSTKTDAAEEFKAPHWLSFQLTCQQDSDAMHLAFSKGKESASHRKSWLLRGCEVAAAAAADIHDSKIIPLTDFVHKDLIQYAIYSTMRAIPSILDGMTPSRRKIMDVSLKQSRATKVAQLAAIVANETGYHHGESSLMSSIIDLAHDYVGSNNVPLLTNEGEFGTRRMGGADASAPRYIYTAATHMARKLFHPDDMPLLTRIEDEGKLIEPAAFIPVLPTLLLNGADGIATGYSTKIPPYSIHAIIDNIKRKLVGQDMVPMIPYHRGFLGTLDIQDKRYVTTGNFERINSNTLRITELPIGVWTETYLEWLMKSADELGVERMIEGQHVVDSVDITCTMKGVLPDLDSDIISKFQLSRTHSMQNMHAWNSAGKLIKYNSPLDILEEWIDVRLDYYKRRKIYLLQELRHKLERIECELWFITGIIDGTITVFRRTRADIIDQITRGLPLQAPTSTDYLLTLPVSSFTQEKLNKLEQLRTELKTNVSELEEMAHEQLWINDITVITELI